MEQRAASATETSQCARALSWCAWYWRRRATVSTSMRRFVKLPVGTLAADDVSEQPL
jgi:hypothetical protein